MAERRDGNIPTVDARHRGLLKLMVKLPSVRGRLQMIAARPAALGELFEAYDTATHTLEELERKGSATDELIHEYRTICTEIETDVVRYCLAHIEGTKR